MLLVTIVRVVFLVGAVLMVFLILLQEGKGGGLAALGGTRAAGVEGVTNPVRRATAYLAAAFFVLAIMIGILSRPEKGVGLLSPDQQKKEEPETHQGHAEKPAEKGAVPPTGMKVVPPEKGAPAKAPEAKPEEKPGEKAEPGKKSEEGKVEPKPEAKGGEAPRAPDEKKTPEEKKAPDEKKGPEEKAGN